MELRRWFGGRENWGELVAWGVMDCLVCVCFFRSQRRRAPKLYHTRQQRSLSTRNSGPPDTAGPYTLPIMKTAGRTTPKLCTRSCFSNGIFARMRRHSAQVASCRVSAEEIMSLVLEVARSRSRFPKPEWPDWAVHMHA